MARLPVIAAAVLAIAASASVIGTASAGWRDRDGDVDRDLRDLLRDRIQTRQDLRDFIIDLLHDRQDSRRRLRERAGHWRDRGDEEDEDSGGLRGRLRERVGHWRDRGDEEDEDGGGLRARLRERVGHWRDRGDEQDEDGGGLRGRLRERVGHWRDRGDEEDEDGGGLRGRLRERVGDRVAERRRGGEEGDCYILTRSLRDADRDLLVVVRRRVCRD